MTGQIASHESFTMLDNAGITSEILSWAKFDMEI